VGGGLVERQQLRRRRGRGRATLSRQWFIIILIIVIVAIPTEGDRILIVVSSSMWPCPNFSSTYGVTVKII
jgi:hypothetical protein